MQLDGVLDGVASGWIWRDVSGLTLEVDQDNVIPAIKLILDEAEQFTFFAIDRLPALRVGVPLGDPVSATMATAANTRLFETPESFFARCWEYAERLVELAEALADAARTYGHTEEEIRGLFAGARQGMEELDSAWSRQRSLGDRDGDSYAV